MIKSIKRTARFVVDNVWLVIFISIAAASLILGYRGFAEYVPNLPGFSPRRLDLIYYDLQLFVLGSPPLDQGGSLPPPLQIARFTAPAVTVYALIEAARAGVGGQEDDGPQARPG